MFYSREYDASYSPTMPVVEITIGNPENGMNQDLLAIIDSGSDGTIVPLRALHRLGLPRIGWINSRGISGISYRLPVYLVELQIGGNFFGEIRVTGDRQNQIILGRNVLNWLTVTLDGLGQMLTIVDQ